MIIGLTGKRGVGKSEVADILEEYGFERIHTFNGGKAATVAYFRHLGMPADLADESVYGELKDAPNDYLPHRSTPRYFMERFGHFMADLGVEWTLGAELNRIVREYPRSPIVVESIAYEADLLRARGGLIVRVSRPNHDGPAGMETDAAQEAIIADAEIINDGDIDSLAAKVISVVGGICKLPATRNLLQH